MTSVTGTTTFDGTLVKRIPTMPAPVSFEIEPAKKTREGLDLELHTIAELMQGPGLLKRCYVKPNIPSFGAFEMHSDEGTVIGGSDLAPAPLSYLAAGIAFCLLTHLKGCADSQGLNISSIRVEQKMKFQSRIPGMTADMGGQMEGHSNGLETFVLIETQEDDEVITRMSDIAERACMAAQTVVNAVPASLTVTINGRQI
ncbi:OsmC-related (seleno)protein [Anderseniella sp. Alg231-50]|uniref:OsmC-related (seleno)protein n=1 Tax=Anderseniella sp. Alg231-50 TaxID=1922226 RepID=UPI000D562D7C